MTEHTAGHGLGSYYTFQMTPELPPVILNQMYVLWADQRWSFTDYYTVTELYQAVQQRVC